MQYIKDKVEKLKNSLLHDYFTTTYALEDIDVYSICMVKIHKIMYQF